jgi:hypothetical protein
MYEAVRCLSTKEKCDALHAAMHPVPALTRIRVAESRARTSLDLGAATALLGGGDAACAEAGAWRENDDVARQHVARPQDSYAAAGPAPPLHTHV